MQCSVTRKDWLESAGYRLYTRQLGWWEVLAVGTGERWMGRGGTLEEALEEILWQMFPSRASREGRGGIDLPSPERDTEQVLISSESGKATCESPRNPEAMVESPPGHDTVRNPVTEPELPKPRKSGEIPLPASGPSPAPTDESADPVDELSLDGTTSSPSPSLRQDQSEAGTPTASLPDNEEADQTRPAPDMTEFTALVPVREEADAPTALKEGDAPSEESPARHTGPLERPELLSEFRLLRQEILDRRLDFGLLAPVRQRLCLTHWAARMRVLQQGHEADPDVEVEAQAIARLLGDFAGVYWPGNVPALNLSCTPAKALTVLEKNRRPSVREWTEVADAMNDALHQAETDDSVDEYGWADEAALDPRSEHPEEEFAGIRGQIARIFPEDPDLRRPPPKGIPAALLPSSPEERQQVRRMCCLWARMTRWLRQDVRDVARWGRVMGRLRWIVARYPNGNHEFQTLREELSRTLDAQFCPRVPWARLLGRDAERKARRQVRQQLGQRISSLDGSDVTSWMDWFLDAVRHVDLPTLRRWMEPREGIRKSLQEHVSEHPELLQPLSKTQRRRARRLLQGEMDVPPEEEDLELESDEDPESADLEDSSLRPEKAAIPMQVRQFTEGKRAVFVGNRGQDPELHQSLLERLAFAELDFVDGNDPRRLDGLAERVSGGAYDLVLAATGFLSHRVDRRLLPLCRNSGVPYFRVHRGRLGACVRAIDQGLGAGGSGAG